jgi:hypothetical protein
MSSLLSQCAYAHACLRHAQAFSISMQQTNTVPKPIAIHMSPRVMSGLAW